MAERVSRIAGTFLSSDQVSLERRLNALIRPFADRPNALTAAPCAVVAPHGPLEDGGSLAAAAWAATSQSRPARIAILSAAHHCAVNGIAVPTGHDVVRVLDKRSRIDTRACRALIRSGLTHGGDLAFEEDHGIDVHLPFARHLHPKTPVVPILIGQATPRDVARVIDRVSRMEGETLFVLSSDLSRTPGESAAASLDAECAKFLETGQPETLTAHHACGHLVLSGWQLSGAGTGARALRLGVSPAARSEQDETCGAGYGAWAFYPAEAEILDTAARALLLTVARQALVSRLAKGVPPVIDSQSFAAPVQTFAASFVALALNGVPRGHAGSVIAHAPLVADVAQNAVKAGFDDPRFPPLTEPDLSALTLSISVLSAPVSVAARSEEDLIAALEPGVSGVILSASQKRVVILPAEWASLRSPEAFVAALKRKAGIGPRDWDETIKAQVFRTERFSEGVAQTDVA